MSQLSRLPAWIAGIQSTGMWCLGCHPWLLGSGNPCRNDGFGIGYLANQDVFYSQKPNAIIFITNSSTQKHRITITEKAVRLLDNMLMIVHNWQTLKTNINKADSGV